VKSEVATFFAVFPDGMIWGNDNKGEGYDTVLLGSAERLTIPVDEAQRRMEGTPAVAASLHDVGIWSAIALFARYAGQASDLGPWLQHAEINRDRNLRLQYLAGMASNVYQEGSIYDGLLYYRKFPEERFTGSEETKETLRGALASPKSLK
jgi:spermidine synthase